MAIRPKKATKKPVARAKSGGSPPPPGTIIIIKPKMNNLEFTIQYGSAGATTVTGVGAGTTALNESAFSTVLYARATFNFNGTVYHDVSCRRVMANLNVGGPQKAFLFETLDGVPSWWLNGTEYVPDNTTGPYDWNADLLNAFYTGTVQASVRVQLAGSNPSWIDSDVMQVEIGLV